MLISSINSEEIDPTLSPGPNIIREAAKWFSILMHIAAA